MTVTISELKKPGYERVVRIQDYDEGLNAFVAIHNTRLGPALGGCRAMGYESDEAALEDCLKLAEGMTYKAALARQPLGGGKSVIRLHEGQILTPWMLRSFAQGLNMINKNEDMYFTAGDVGTSNEHLDFLADHTKYVNGSGSKQDSGKATAFGVLQAMNGALEFLGRDIKEQTVGVAGYGKVGRRLTTMLVNSGAMVIAADPYVGEHGIPIQPNTLGRSAFDKVHTLGTVFAPCAVGGAINEKSVSGIKRGSLICGGANNQLSDSRMYWSMQARDLTYVPDFVANAGGIIVINTAGNMTDLAYDHPEVLKQLVAIGPRTKEILERAKSEKMPTEVVAIQMAKEIIGGTYDNVA